MKSSGSRSKRAKLLKKEIALLRNKLSQQHSQAPPTGAGTGGFEDEAAPLAPDTAEEVLPRLETLLQPRKRSRSTCGDSEVEEESPGKRLDTGKWQGQLSPRAHNRKPWGSAFVFAASSHSCQHVSDSRFGISTSLEV